MKAPPNLPTAPGTVTLARGLAEARRRVGLSMALSSMVSCTSIGTSSWPLMASLIGAFLLPVPAVGQTTSSQTPILQAFASAPAAGPMIAPGANPANANPANAKPANAKPANAKQDGGADGLNTATSPYKSSEKSIAPAENGGEFFSAKKQPAEAIFKAIAAAIGRPMVLSSKVRKYRLTGDFNLDDPQAALANVSASLGLIWYYDGQAIYLYDASEIGSAIIKMPPESVKGLLAFLHKAALYDNRYPVRSDSVSGTLYVSGPPKYMEIIQNAARLFQTEQRQQEVKVRTDNRKRVIELIKLQHAFVGDRSYDMRGQKITVPGIASAIGQILERTSDSHRNGDVVSYRDSSAPLPGPLGNPLANGGSSPLSNLQAGQPGSALADGEAPGAPFPTVADLNGDNGYGGSFNPGGTVLPTLDASGTPGSIDLAQIRAAANARFTAEDDIDVTVVPYTTDNTLLVKGTPAQIDLIKRLVTALDVSRRQIELSLWILDISKDQVDQLGVNWHVNLGMGGGGLDFSSSASGNSLISSGETRQFLAAITALSHQGRARVVSRPILLAQENIPAIFDNSRTFSIKLAAERYAQVQSVTYGTMVNALPRVAGDGQNIEMTLDIEDGNLASEGSMNSVDGLPIVGRTKLSTVARVAKGQNLLIGGYTRDQVRVGNDKIPLLGDIPWIGNLFRSRSTTADQLVRIFLIEPRLLEEDSTDNATLPFTPPAGITDAVEKLRQDIEDAHGQH